MNQSERVVTQRLAELTREVTQTRYADDGEVLTTLAASALDALPGARYAGITLADRNGDVRTVAATHAHAATLDDIQRRHRQGPCLSAAWEQHAIRMDDVATDERWPLYSRDVVAGTPVRSVLSYQLFTAKTSVGALNFLCDRTHAFDDDAVEEGLVFATHVAIAWNVLQRDKQFRSALASRDIIGQAKGMLMERFDIDAVQAFDLLKRLSQEANLPLAHVAAQLVDVDHPPR